ncbi:hypothetical protein ACMFMF_007988 [Clarireedia jacksonii]
MAQEGFGGNKQYKVKKRAPNACSRCRQQKIKCSGILPCEQCSKRSLACNFEDKDRKILVSREYINSLQQRAESIGQTPRTHNRTRSLDTVNDDQNTAVEYGNDSQAGSYSAKDHIAGGQSITTLEVNSDVCSDRGTPEPRLVNPLSGGAQSYTSDSDGKPWYLGSSSNWSFGRRVLSMAHERAFNSSLPSKDLSFDGKTYDIGWDGLRTEATAEPTVLPSSDYAIYLINAVKFHCGQMFHLFDEQTFMEQFTQFHQTPENREKRSGLWFIHYLLILAFGKALIVRSNAGQSPPGADMFVWAMKCLPDTVYMCTQSVESIEVLCCVALYLQSLDFRISAYNFIGQALRIALGFGMHTPMEKQSLDDKFVQRCRKAWWTIYVLDRQMSSLMGVPLGIRDEDVTAFLPTFSGSFHKTLALEIHVKLSRIISQILNTVYGRDGRLSRKYLSCTKAALKSIASVTDQLNRCFEIPVSASMAGISRLSAYLHLLYHQCVTLATRPLLFSLFKMRLDTPELVPTHALGSSGARVLLQMCIESSNQILNVLSGLQKQSLLESFLPFDLDAAFSAIIIVVLTPAVDPSLLENPQHGLQIGYTILDEMAFRGNAIAATRKMELRLLEDLLNRIHKQPVSASEILNTTENTQTEASQSQIPSTGVHVNDPPQSTVDVFTDPEILANDYWSRELNSEQLLSLAESLDMDGIDWMTISDSNIAE